MLSQRQRFETCLAIHKYIDYGYKNGSKNDHVSSTDAFIGEWGDEIICVLGPICLLFEGPPRHFLLIYKYEISSDANSLHCD